MTVGECEHFQSWSENRLENLERREVGGLTHISIRALLEDTDQEILKSRDTLVHYYKKCEYLEFYSASLEHGFTELKGNKCCLGIINRLSKADKDSILIPFEKRIADIEAEKAEKDLKYKEAARLSSLKALLVEREKEKRLKEITTLGFTEKDAKELMDHV